MSDETQGAKMEEGCVETEEGGVKVKEATFVAVYEYVLITDESSELLSCVFTSLPCDTQKLDHTKTSKFYMK